MGRYLRLVGISLAISLVAILVLSVALVMAQDAGSRECRVVQLEAQAAAGDPAGYKNHGQWVAAAAKVVSPYVEDGTITEECSSCIINQFGRGIPIADQEACGPDVPECAEAGRCGAWTRCNVGGNCGSDGICVQTDATPSGGFCVNGMTSCYGLALCLNGTGDCAAGEICAFNTCCGRPLCTPPVAFCWAP